MELASEPDLEWTPSSIDGMSMSPWSSPGCGAQAPYVPCTSGDEHPGALSLYGRGGGAGGGDGDGGWGGDAS